MELDKEGVQKFVDDAVNYYEEQSIIGNGVSFQLRDSERVPFKECRRETTVGADTMNSKIDRVTVREQIDQITGCEEVNVVQDLHNESSLVEKISRSEFAKDLLIKSIRLGPLFNDNRVLLPNQQPYRSLLRDEYGTDEYLPNSDKVPIYWFDPDILQDCGFVVRRNVPVIQETHGSKYAIVNEKLQIGELEGENSENRLMIHLGSSGFHPIEVSLWTKFSNLQMVDDESVWQLDLPETATL